MDEHPFVPGARVAIEYSDGRCREDFVEKVYKTGRFTLREGGRQQWKPYEHRDWKDGSTCWKAQEAGKYRSRRYVTIWNAATGAKITAQMAAHRRHVRWQDIKAQVWKLRDDDVSDALLDQLEGAFKLGREGETGVPAKPPQNTE